MPERILICVAWPYANGWLHLGHVAGCYLPADIFARYHRLKGNQVLMVSGSDQHGTPITLRAEQDGVPPQEVVDRYHKAFLDSWERLGITFDLFTTTGTDNHREMVQDVFRTLQARGYIYSSAMDVSYCPQCSRFLPDRYVKGTCPYCGNTDTRGDQCDQCGKPLDPKDLGAPRCQICGSPIDIRESEHFFLKLSAFQGRLLEWVEQQGHWRPNVLNFTRSYIQEGLRDRAISRDILWGVPLPMEGYDQKRIYVWFEAVIGYLSASKEWSQRTGTPESWREFWEDPQVRSYYFIGKDNIPFHTIIWPAMLMGYGSLNLPYDVPANEFLIMEGRQLSTSRNWAVWLPDYLERYDPDPLRYYLSANMPETADSGFSWREFVRRNNNELVATYGNLAHRVLNLVYRNCNGQVPQPGALSSLDQELLKKGRAALDATDSNLYGCRFRAALSVAMNLARACNKYLDTTEPWKVLKEDHGRAATTLWVALSVINCLKLLLYPFMPFSSQKLHHHLGFAGDLERQGWRWEPDIEFLPPGQTLPKPQPLFTKLDDEVVEQEVQRMGTPVPQ